MNKFNIRVYGILIDEQQRLLVSDEFIRGKYFTKLPGGGLEFGEGTRECLQREFMEETGLSVSVTDHYYTTDFFIISAFNNKDQIISIYYKVHCSNLSSLKIAQTKFSFTEEQTAVATNQAESFRFIPLQELQIADVSLPIDKVVVEMLLKDYAIGKL